MPTRLRQSLPTSRSADPPREKVQSFIEGVSQSSSFEARRARRTVLWWRGPWSSDSSDSFGIILTVAET